MRVLLTSTSFQDTSGPHQQLLTNTGWEVDTLRGPLNETEVLQVIDNYDGLICGDDDISAKVIKKGCAGRLRAISKYGIGLDKIDLVAAQQYGIPVANTPGVNHVAVSEHAFMFILAHFKNFYKEASITKQKKWTRLIGHELHGKKIAILGLGRIGKELSKRCKAFGLNVWGYDIDYDNIFMSDNEIKALESPLGIDLTFDIISLHMPLNTETIKMFDNEMCGKLSQKVLMVNTARADLIDKQAVTNFLRSNPEAALYTDVLWEEPISPNDDIVELQNVYVTPHIGSRTYESVARQGSKAVHNMISLLESNVHLP
jgi:D-3-phosphoglycerate dehydrogenase / 2-oxoglutarate reductase